jgi:hypothetical protein
MRLKFVDDVLPVVVGGGATVLWPCGQYAHRVTDEFIGLVDLHRGGYGHLRFVG